MAEHKNITDPYNHEPKGASTALENTVYVSDGVGSGAWEIAKIEGQPAAAEGSIPLSDGVGGVSWANVLEKAVARTHLVNQNVVIPLSAGGVHISGDYTDVTANFTQAYNVGGFTFDATSHFIVPVDGIYRIATWVSLSSDATNAPTIGMDLNINGVASGPNSAVVQSSQKDANDIVTLAGHGTGVFSAGDVVGLSFAATSSTNITLYDSVFDIEYVRS